MSISFRNNLDIADLLLRYVFRMLSPESEFQLCLLSTYRSAHNILFMIDWPVEATVAFINVLSLTCVISASEFLIQHLIHNHWECNLDLHCHFHFQHCNAGCFLIDLLLYLLLVITSYILSFVRSCCCWDIPCSYVFLLL